ncbi:MAG: translation initiation factor IF-2 N-terminal domain-containing protein, partial [Actinomycetota bacterium]
MAKKIRVHELSKELGLTSKEVLELAGTLHIGATSPSASIEDAQADRIRRKVDSAGLRRGVQPEEPKPTKAVKAVKATTAPKDIVAAVEVPEKIEVTPATAPAESAAPEAAPVEAAPVAPEAPKGVRSRTAPT